MKKIKKKTWKIPHTHTYIYSFRIYQIFKIYRLGLHEYRRQKGATFHDYRKVIVRSTSKITVCVSFIPNSINFIFSVSNNKHDSQQSIYCEVSADLGASPDPCLLCVTNRANRLLEILSVVVYNCQNHRRVAVGSAKRRNERGEGASEPAIWKLHASRRACGNFGRGGNSI